MPAHARWSLTAAFIVLCIFALIGVVAARQLEVWRNLEISRARDHVETVGVLLSEKTRVSIRSVDRNMQLAVQELGPLIADATIDFGRVERILARHDSVTEYTRYWGVFDAAGNLIADTRVAPKSGLNIADRAYFREHLDTADSSLVISKPLRAKTTGDRVFSLSRRIEATDQTLLGVIVVGYDLRAFGTFVRSAGAIADVDIQLVHIDRDPAADTSYFGPAALSGAATVKARVLVADTPMNYVVSRNRADVLKAWSWTRWVVIGGLVVCALVSAVAAALPIHLLFRLQRRRTAMEALGRAKDTAERASEAKSNFLAAMSHEIRTPLNGVLGMTRLMQQTPLDDDQRHMMKTIAASGEQLMAVLNDVLDTARHEGDALRLSRQPIVLAELLDGVAHEAAALAAEKGLALDRQLELSPQLRVLGDPVRVRQVVSNLLTNAMKFTERGCVRLSCHVDEEDQRVVATIEVSDTGIGIAPEDLDRVFQRFTQVDAANNRRAGGSGLGLTIVKSIIEQMQGSVGVRSKLGAGTTFTVTVPFDKASLMTDDWRPKRPDIADLSVFIVDDDDVGREVVARTLRLWGLTVAEERCADTALRRLLIDREGFDVLLVDQRMPGRRGSELITALRQDHSLAETPIVLMSSDPSVVELPIGSRTMLLRRPVLPDVLAETLRCLAEPRSADAPLLDASEPADLAVESARALIVEDNAVNRDILRRTLESLDFQVDEACDGRTAIELAARGCHDVVFMDIQMPGMDGLESTARIRALPGDAASVPIIALTANAMPGDRERYLAAGMDDYVAKPIDVEALVAALRGLLMEDEVEAAIA